MEGVATPDPLGGKDDVSVVVVSTLDLSQPGGGLEIPADKAVDGLVVVDVDVDNGFPHPEGGVLTPAVVGATETLAVDDGLPHPGGGLTTPIAGVVIFAAFAVKVGVKVAWLLLDFFGATYVSYPSTSSSSS